MNKDTKIDIEDVFDIDAIIGLRNEITRHTGTVVNSKDSLYIVNNKYIEEKEEMRRLMREMLIVLYNTDLNKEDIFKDGMKLLGLTAKDLN